MKTLPHINPNTNFFIPLADCTSNKPTEIVILDPTVPEAHHLANGIKPGTATYLLESQPDAVEQITTILGQHTGITAVHIISHGSSGSLYLGTTELNSSNIDNYSPMALKKSQSRPPFRFQDRARFLHSRIRFRSAFQYSRFGTLRSNHE